MINKYGLCMLSTSIEHKCRSRGLLWRSPKRRLPNNAIAMRMLPGCSSIAVCGTKCIDPDCLFLRTPEFTCRSLAKHGHCKQHFFHLLNTRATGDMNPYPWAAEGCRWTHYVPSREVDNGGKPTGKVKWYVLKDNVERLSCADGKTEAQWIAFYNDQHAQDVDAKRRSDAARDQKAIGEVLHDSAVVQARAARDEKIKARREGTEYNPVEFANGLAPHLQLENQSGQGRGQSQAMPIQSLFKTKEKKVNNKSQDISFFG